MNADPNNEGYTTRNNMICEVCGADRRDRQISVCQAAGKPDVYHCNDNPACIGVAHARQGISQKVTEVTEAEKLESPHVVSYKPTFPNAQPVVDSSNWFEVVRKPDGGVRVDGYVPKHLTNAQAINFGIWLLKMADPDLAVVASIEREITKS
ncbi:MAG: hypothetical protein JWQ04_659 [Pedosphaera sp.]|nr:hypothetical protein [Pedosphaera sp.]